MLESALSLYRYALAKVVKQIAGFSEALNSYAFTHMGHMHAWKHAEVTFLLSAFFLFVCYTVTAKCSCLSVFFQS